MSGHDRGVLLPSPTFHPYAQVDDMNSSANPVPRPRPKPKGVLGGISIVQTLSYALDWIILIILAVAGAILGKIKPNQRHFSLQDPNISFPFTEHELVPSSLLLVCNAVIPVVVILVVTLLFVPGSTVPPGTPRSLIWKRKLWELHTGWLGLAAALCGAWWITSMMKNLFGKPRPDLLMRCDPDIANWFEHLAGFATPNDNGTLATAGSPYNGQLVKASICRNTDEHIMFDGFRSYPSGHSSSAAAGLIYLSLFLASKFVTTLPFVPGDSYTKHGTSAFPSRARDPTSSAEDLSDPSDPIAAKQLASHSSQVSSIRRQAAAPPIYLLTLTLLPFFLAIFIAGSRWCDFRHHGFDILFGFIIGTITAFFAFRYYHLPLTSGAGWAWGPRSHDKAFWAGVGSYSFATSKDQYGAIGDPEERLAPTYPPRPGAGPNDFEMRTRYGGGSGPEDFEHHNANTEYQGARM